MNSDFPFYSSEPEANEAPLYHTHPRCRIAQSVMPGNRVAGTGEGRRECPFCFLLGEFQANRALRKRLMSGPGAEPPPPGQLGAATSPATERTYQ